MNFFDILTIVALVWAVVSGWRSGFISQLFGLLGIIAGVVLAVRLGPAVGEMFKIDQSFAAVAGFIIIFVATIIVAAILSKLLSSLISFIGLHWVNTLLGILFSIVKGVVVLSLLYAAILELNAHLGFIQPAYFDSSISFDIVRQMAEPLFDYWESLDVQPVNPPQTI